MTSENMLIFGLALITSLAAGIFDIWKRKIPNFLTLPTLFLGLLLHCGGFADHDSYGRWEGWQFSLAGLAVGFGLTAVPSMISKGGGGDIKLAAALGSLLGPRAIFLLLGIAFIIAAVATVTFFILRDGVLSTLRLLTRSPQACDNKRPEGNRPTSTSNIKLPLGPFFFVATVIVIAILKP